MNDLSVLICSTNTRWKTFGQAIQRQIWAQYDALPEADRGRIEILMLTDNKSMMLGAKRNAMVDICSGRYIAFVDDDDRLDDQYLPALLAATGSDADVITFEVSVSINGNDPMICYYSKDFPADHNRSDRYERLPNHLMAVKRDISRKVSFPHIAYGEDSGYSKLLRPHLKTQYAIGKVLYHYDYNELTTEAQDHKRNATRQREGQAPVVDIVILSNASTPELRRMTQVTVRSAIAGANSLPVNVIVLEQARTSYRFAHTIRTRQPFNYNRFANQGARMGGADWIMIANNDLIFHDGWLHQLLAADHPLVSPKCPKDQRQAAVVENTIGDRTAVNLSGWCFMLRRELWEKIGGFDECVKFWFSDDVVIEQAKAVGVLPMLVPAAEVEHLQSITLKQLSSADDLELTWGQLPAYEARYGPHRLSNDPRYKRWKKRGAVNPRKMLPEFFQNP